MWKSSENTNVAQQPQLTIYYDPEQAAEVSPVDGAIEVDPATSLIWQEAPGATEHKVYFGTTSGALDLMDTVPASAKISTDPNLFEWIPSAELDLTVEYFWRIDEVIGGETLEGEEWSFTIAVLQPGHVAVTLSPTDDATIQSSKPDWNLGIRDNMWVNGDGPHQLSFLKFDLAAEVPGAVKAATLSMKTLSTNSGFTQTRARPVLYGPSGEWFEGNGNDQFGIPDTTGVGITYNTNDLIWDPAVLDEVTGSPIPASTRFDFDVSGLIREADAKATIGLDAPDMTQGWRGWLPKEKVGDEPVLTVVYDPSEAYAPIPINTSAFEVHPRTMLSWMPGDAISASNTVYISKDPDPIANAEATIVVAKGALDPNRVEADLSTDFPTGLDLDTVYYWAVDNGEVNSEVWSFNTMAIDPIIPQLIAPADTEEDVVIP
ncbi:MAG: hypothetical protein KAT00_09260, partial [Planctomycetes bacterium]|nr:hypothetical protein [Planctomycetota bacterium]